MSNPNELMNETQIQPQTKPHCNCGQLLDSNRLVKYTENTTIHGLKYLGEKQRPITGKIFWIVIFVISFIILGFFVQDVLNKFNQKSVILVEDDRPTPIHSIPFPAVTICPTIKIKNGFLPDEEQIKWWTGSAEQSMVLDLAYLICNQQLLTIMQEQRNATQYFNQSYIELLHKISPNAKETFAVFTFASKIERMYTGNVTPPYILTNDGICFTFNVPSEIIANVPSLQTEYKYHNIENKTKSWDKDYGYSGYPMFPKVVWGRGPGSGLYLIINSNISDLNTFCQPTQIGYKILLHSPDEYPTTIENFISIPHSTMTQIKVTPKITKTSYDLSKLKPELRQCFFDYERKLKYFTYYNEVNCKLECLANYSMQQYGCVHFSLPRNNSQPICGTGVRITQIYHLEEIMNSYFQFKAKITDEYDALLEFNEPEGFNEYNNFQCKCLPACNSVEYEYSVEMENIEIEKMKKKYFPNNVGDNISTVIVDIFFGVTKATGMTRKQYYTFSDLISNIGGLLGLFMGASILSVFEIIYFLIVR